MKKENNGPTDVEQKTTGKLIASSLNNSTVVYHSYNVGKLENYSPSFINVFHPPDQPNPRITRPLPRPSSATAINNFQHLPSVTKSTSNYRLDPSSGRPNVNLNVNSINANSRYNYFTDPRHRQSSPTKYHYPYYQPRRNPYSRNGYMQRPVYRPRPRGRGGYSPKDFLRSHLETNSYQRGRVDLKRLFWFPTAACKGPQRIKVENRPSTSTSAPLWPFMNYVSEIERGRNRNRNSNEEGDGWYVVRFVDDDSPIPIKKMSDHGLRNLPAEVSSIFSYLKNMYNTGPFSLNVNDIWRWFLHGDHVKSNK